MPATDELTPRKAVCVLDGGPDGLPATRYRERLAELMAGLRTLQPSAEERRAFPAAAIAMLGEAGVLRERWASGAHGDLGRAVVLAEELGYAGIGGIGVGISLHTEAVLGILTRFARTDALAQARDAALDGRWIGCLATSEQLAGSDLTSVQTTVEPAPGGWRVTGKKAFVSPGAAADFALVLGRKGSDPERRGFMAPLSLALVPRSGLTVERTLATVGMRSLGTARVTVAATVSGDALVGRPGSGLATVSWGLIHERLAMAAQVLGAARLTLALTVSRARRRRQFGVPLIGHQALRLRLADLSAQVELARRGIWSIASDMPVLPGHGLRASAAAKVTATRLGARIQDEAMHIFGGAGYLEDETPMSRMWRDSRIGRLGGGSDEVMWELVAGGMRGDDEAYARLVRSEAEIDQEGRRG